MSRPQNRWDDIVFEDISRALTTRKPIVASAYKANMEEEGLDRRDRVRDRANNTSTITAKIGVRAL
jgi:hypothetical protein